MCARATTARAGTDDGARAPRHRVVGVMTSATASPFGLVMTPRASLETRLRRRERGRHRRRVVLGDVAGLVSGVAVSSAVLAIAFAFAPADLATAGAALVLVMLATLSAAHTREPGIPPSREARRVLLAGAIAFAIGACAVAVAPSDPARGALLAGVPACLAAVLLSRWYWHRWAPRSLRPTAPRAVLVGSRAVLEALAPTLDHARPLGYQVVGATVTDADGSAGPAGLPILGPATATAEAARAVQAETVVVAGATDDPDFVRRLSWQLEGTATNLVLATPLTDVAVGRISLGARAGLALVNVRIPTYDGAQHIVKRGLDIVVALCALVPIMLATPFIAAAIRLDSPGPVLFRQCRVGRDGREFQIVKFRTMRTGAADEVDALAAANEGSGVLFKVRHDPRVTRLGRFLRKYSIDELPQFWNVLVGDMSVVGPRPPLPREVRAYDVPVFRRLYLRPGITGPWQIGGRSDLTWEQSVRLDLHYVENWSVTSDLAIILRTAAVVLRAKGAY